MIRENDTDHKQTTWNMTAKQEREQKQKPTDEA